MSSHHEIISNPIKEIIFSISFADNIDINCLNKFIDLSEVKENFPTIQPGYNANFKHHKDGKPTVTNVEKTGYIMKCDEPCNRIIQAKLGLFAFHKTKEYEKFENLIQELGKYWKLFQDCTGNLKITNISLRYLNFIELYNDENIKDYLNVVVSSPFGEDSNEFVQLKFKAGEDALTDVTLVLTESKDDFKKGIILDIILNRKYDSLAFEDIAHAFDGMREIKNDIFQKSITYKTKNKYNL